MTLNQMVEFIQQDYPQYGFTQLKIMLNQAYKEFCRRTGILRKSYTFPNIDTWEIIETNWEDYTITVSYAIPSTIDEITEVRWLNEAEEYVSFDDTGLLGYEVKDGVLKLYYQYTEGFNVAGINAYQNVEVLYKAIPEDLSDVDDSTEFDSVFDDALIARVMHRLATRAKDATANMYYAEWKDLLLEGKRKANKQQDGTGYNLTSYQYPGQT